MIHISLNAVPMGTTVNTSALVQIMDCRLTCDKPLSEPTLVKMSSFYGAQNANHNVQTKRDYDTGIIWHLYQNIYINLILGHSDLMLYMLIFFRVNVCLHFTFILIQPSLKCYGHWQPWRWFNIQMSFYQYMESYNKDKTVLWLQCGSLFTTVLWW